MFAKIVWPKLFLFFVLCTFAVPAAAQEVHQDLKEIIEARVVEVLDEFERPIYGTDTVVDVQVVKAEVLTGEQIGETIEFENELVPLSDDDHIYLNHVVMIDGYEYYMFKDYKRQSQLVVLLVMFAAALIWFAGRQGFLALLSLGLSIAAIFFILIPALLAGYDPILVSLGVASVILSLVFFITHGITPTSLIAFGGTYAAVLVTCLIAWFWVGSMHLTGFGDETAVYLNFSTDGQLDFAGLLLGSIIIGILGVLDDVSITQAAVVRELFGANKTLSMVELYHRAIRVGRDHVGSLVNTLALAYVGASLPLILLFSAASSDWYLSLNQEVIAAEIVRIIVGSFGLVLAVPFTTLIAAWYFAKYGIDENDTSSCGHSHVH